MGRPGGCAHGAGRTAADRVRAGGAPPTSRDVARRWRAECAARLPPGCDARVVIAVGVNDTTVEDGSPRVPAAQSAAHLDELVHGVQDAGWPALVVGPPPISDQASNDRIGRPDAAFAAVCEAAAVGYVPVLDQLSADPVWMRQVAAADGAHPGADGYQRLADLVWPRWLPWITAGAP